MLCINKIQIHNCWFYGSAQNIFFLSLFIFKSFKIDYWLSWWTLFYFSAPRNVCGYWTDEMGIAFSLDTSNNRCVLINLSLEKFICISLFNLNIEQAFQDLKYFVLDIGLELPHICIQYCFWCFQIFLTQARGNKYWCV